MFQKPLQRPERSHFKGRLRQQVGGIEEVKLPVNTKDDLPRVETKLKSTSLRSSSKGSHTSSSSKAKHLPALSPRAQSLFLKMSTAGTSKSKKTEEDENEFLDLKTPSLSNFKSTLKQQISSASPSKLYLSKRGVIKNEFDSSEPDGGVKIFKRRPPRVGRELFPTGVDVKLGNLSTNIDLKKLIINESKDYKNEFLDFTDEYTPDRKDTAHFKEIKESRKPSSVFTFGVNSEVNSVT